ncbi:hypothetical protein VM1G_11577 [Cytospora mali]|uniref:Uncharacterized protein n=1 Tax=Cytospora mali TaxID=578113 RepID=A0A194VVX3_CYTMA|nr:hypothetical protein VM1G_11577 [Valsa mali]
MASSSTPTPKGPTEDPRLEWRAGFRRRLKRALEFMQGTEKIGLTQSRHFRSFARLVADNGAYRQEVQKLSPFELELLCISSTEQQLQSDVEYFTANEVVQALSINSISTTRRTEVREKILRNLTFEGLGRIYKGTVANGSYGADTTTHPRKAVQLRSRDFN